MDIGMERYFQIPGQDLVWRYVTPGRSALEGGHSTMAKCASSAMIHLGRRRNSNELYGAYGHELTFEEVKWLANWCFVRGQNLLYPHAFYYSVRGPRRDERPPDVGPNAAWWNQFRPFADACRRLAWVNTDVKHVCHVALLGDSQRLPDQSAKILYQHQRDFNYLELRHLWEDAEVADDGVRLAGMHYEVVVLDDLPHLPRQCLPALSKLARAGRLIIWEDANHAAVFRAARHLDSPRQLVDAIDSLAAAPVLKLDPPATSVRLRHVVKPGRNFVMLFNEEAVVVRTRLQLKDRSAERQWWNPYTGDASPADDEMVTLQPYELKLLTYPVE
jgi:hypothetical protein